MVTIVLTTSDWIALAACVGSFIALIPAFSQMLHTKKNEKHAENAPNTDKNKDTSTKPTEPEPLRQLNGFGRALLLSSYALTIGVIEIVLFSAMASTYGVEVNIDTMPTNWLVVFYALFVVPGLCLFMAFAFLTSMFDD